MSPKPVNDKKKKANLIMA